MALTDREQDTGRPRRVAVLRVSGELLAERLGLPEPIRVVDGAAGAKGRMEGFVDLALAGDTPLLPAVDRGAIPPMVHVTYREQDGARHIDAWQLDRDTEHAWHAVWPKPRTDLAPLYELYDDLCHLVDKTVGLAERTGFGDSTTLDKVREMRDVLAVYLREADPDGPTNYDPSKGGSGE